MVAKDASGHADFSRPSGRVRWSRVLGWAFAICGLMFAASTIYRGMRAVQLRGLALDASEALQAGQWQRLENVSRRWQEKDPNASMAWLLAAQAAEKLESPGRMVSYIERMPDSDPNKPSALLDVATAYFGPLNQPLRGEAACLKSLELQPNNAEARRRLIFYYCMTLQRSKLIQFARDAIASDNDTPETYVYLIGADWITLSNSGDYNGKWLHSSDPPENFLVAYLVHWAGSAGVDSVESGVAGDALENRQEQPKLQAPAPDKVFESRVASLLGLGTEVNALGPREKLLRAMELYPQNSELIAFRLRDAVAEADVQRVAALLASVPESAAGDNRFFYYKGWLHEALGENAEATEAYRNALKRNPYDWRSQLKLAGTLRLAGEIEEADRLAALGIDGKNLRETIMKLPDVQSIPPTVVQSMVDYSRRCGDDLVAKALSDRFNQIFGDG